jgi:uncharacterized membrane protein
MLRGVADNMRALVARSHAQASFLAGLRQAFEGIPGWSAVLLIAMIPVFELRGAIPFGTGVMHMKLWQAFVWAVIGNMIPIPFILLFLEPVSRWLSRHSKTMDRFFTWLFARTRRKHSATFEKWKYVGLMIFVAIPLPGTGAWSGALAAFVFGIPFWPALLYIFLGVLIAGGVVSLATSFAGILGWQGSLIAAAIMTLFLIWLFKRTKTDNTRAEPDA